SEVGFRGLALADDLEMKAVSDRVPYEDLAPRVIAAGCDSALVCLEREAIGRSLAGLEQWSADGRLPAARLRGALQRGRALRKTVGKIARAAADPGIEPFRAASADLARALGEIGSMA